MQKMTLSLASFYRESQLYPVGEPSRKPVGAGLNQQLVSVKTYKDPINGKVYGLSDVRFTRHRLTIRSPWCMVKLMQWPSFCGRRGFWVLDSCLPVGTEASFNAMSTADKKTFIVYLVQKSYPEVNVQQLIDDDPHAKSMVAGGNDSAPSLSADELRRLNIHMGIAEPTPQPKQVVHASAADLISAIEGDGKGPKPAAAPPKPKAPHDETVNPYKVHLVPGMPEGHHVTAKGAIFCAGPCDPKKSFAGPRNHKQHLKYREECRVLYPEEYYPRPVVEKPAVVSEVAAPIG